MNTMQLECFAEVAATLNFSKAADHLHVSQPTVSHQIKTLEDELGCALLVRSTRTVRLTDAGFTFLRYAQDIIDLEVRGKQMLARGEGPQAHRLRLGVSDGFESELFVTALRRLHAEDPAFDPVMRTGPHSALLDMIETGTVDVALEFRDPAGAPAGATAFHRLLEAPIACVASADHPLAAAAPGPIESEALTAVGRIAIPNPPATPRAIAQAQRSVAAEFGPERISMCGNVSSAFALVLAGVAVMIFPDIPSLHRGDLRFLPVAGMPEVTLGARVRRGRRSALVDRLLKLLAEELRREPGGA